MTNLTYYLSKKLDDRIVTRELEYDSNNTVLIFYYMPKHSKELIKLKSEVVYNKNVQEKIAEWWLSEYNCFDYTEIIDDPYNYKHIKKYNNFDKCYDGVDNEFNINQY